MTDPNAVVAGALTGAGISSFTIILGAQSDALIVGLIAAVFVSIWLQSIDNHAKALSSVLLSSMLAGYGSPVAVVWMISSTPAFAPNAEALRLLSALLIGACSPALVPITMKYLGNKISGGGQ